MQNDDDNDSMNSIESASHFVWESFGRLLLKSKQALHALRMGKKMCDEDHNSIFDIIL